MLLDSGLRVSELCGLNMGDVDLAAGKFEIRTEALVVPEEDNKYDPNAVRADIDGLAVGHLPREDAVTFRKRYAKTIAAKKPIMCGGHIQKEVTKDKTYYHVELQVDIGD